MKDKSSLLHSSFVLLFTLASTSHAAITTYTDRTTWMTNGTVSYTEDFEGYEIDTAFRTTPLDVGPFTLQTIGTASTGRNFVDVSPFRYSGTPGSFGNAAVDIFVQGSLKADIIFDKTVSGFFADFLWAGNTSELLLTLSLLGGGTASYNVQGRGDALSPFGFWSPNQLITSIRLSNSVNDGFYIDNVSAFSASSSAVPAPAAVWLFGTVLIGLFGFGKRRKVT